MDKICMHCRFWLDDEKDTGECRRRAPSPVFGHRFDKMLAAVRKLEEEYAPATEMDRVDRQAEWPFTDNDDWCGEWEQIVKPE